MNVCSINFKSTYIKDYDKPQGLHKRVATMAVGTFVGSTGSALYYKYKKGYVGKKLFLRSLEAGAAIGLLVDIIGLVCNIFNNTRNKS